MNIGIDLGTTFSLVGLVDAQGKPVLVPDRLDPAAFRTPSIIHVGDGTAVVGDAVLQQLEEDQAWPVVQFPKNHIGTNLSLYTDSKGRRWGPEAFSALILKKLRDDAKAFTGEDPTGAVLAVPAQFNNAQREATRNAGALAGLEVLSLVEEPVAAATYYGLSEIENDRTLFVYDFGGGTFDATLLQASPQGLYVLATEGLRNLGGNLLDEKIMQVVADEFLRVHKVDILENRSAALALRRFAESTKIKLSQPDVRLVRQTLLLAGHTLEVIFTRAQFERLIKPLIEQSLEVCERCLSGAALKWNQIDTVLLTGGSTLVPLVKRMVGDISRISPEKILNQDPHQAVALGASLLAGSSQNGGSGIPALIQQIASFEVSMRVWDRQENKAGLKTLIKRNSPLPAQSTTSFFTTRSEQTRIVFELVQTKGESKDEASLGSFSFGPIRNPRKNYPVEVTVSYDVSGIVKVTARDPHTGEAMEREIEDDASVAQSRAAQEFEMLRNTRVNDF